MKETKVSNTNMLEDISHTITSTIDSSDFIEDPITSIPGVTEVNSFGGSFTKDTKILRIPTTETFPEQISLEINTRNIAQTKKVQTLNKEISNLLKTY